jgi:nitroimidazol reductase NimA-like FMN-containing flavoprotein (pyridoxamine 5'-phosphate oxidase superfamily)
VSNNRIFVLTEARCLTLLASHQHRLGRVAFAEDGDPNWPSILPVNYAYHDDAVFIRNFEGSKLYAALRRQRVAFEVDEVNDDWGEGWSVVAVGTLELVRDSEQRDAVDGLLDSWAADARQYLVRLNIQQLTGREIIAASPGDG